MKTHESRVARLLILISCIITIGLLTLYFQATHILYDYSIIFDAGSSGTRMYVYKWRAGLSAARGDQLVIEQDESCKTEDKGIDKIKSYNELVQSFSNCLSKAYEKVPLQRKNRTHIFLAATAGMRLLEAKNPARSVEILNYIRDYFSKMQFKFINSSQVRIIGGQEEGINAWISVNYFLEKFKYDTKPIDTVGALDLGGASTQNVFVTDTDAQVTGMEKPYYHNLRINGVTYKPYSHSYMCFGINEVSLVYKTLSTQKNQSAACFPKNFTEKFNTNQALEASCATSFIERNNFSLNLIPNTQMTLEGTSNYNECLKDIDIILVKTQCKYDQCSFNNVYQASIASTRKFYAFSNFYYAIKNTQDLLNSSLIGKDLQSFENATKFICSRTFNELRQMNDQSRAEIKEKHLANQCFANNFIIALLSSYGFDSFEKIEFTDKINGYSIGWTLGYVINELNRDDFLPYEAPLRKLPINLYLPITCFISLLVVTIVIYEFSRYCKKKSYAKKYVITIDRETEEELVNMT